MHRPSAARLTAAVAPSLLLAMTLMLGACGDSKTETLADHDKHTMYKHGSVLGGDGGLSLFGPKRRDEAQQAGGIGVNSFLWRASLDTISFMPIASADPFGGVILTDWYSPPATPQERFKINLYILNRQLRADAVKVTAFKQIRDSAGTWRDAPVAPETATNLEDSILTRARQIRISQTGN